MSGISEIGSKLMSSIGSAGGDALKGIMGAAGSIGDMIKKMCGGQCGKATGGAAAGG